MWAPFIAKSRCRDLLTKKTKTAFRYIRAFAVGDNAAGFSAQTGQSLAQFRTDFPAFKGVFSRKKRPIAAHPAAQLAAHPAVQRG